MALFVTIGYGDAAGYDRTDPAARDAAHAHDDALRRGGAVLGVAGPPRQVRNPDGVGVDVRDGRFATSSLPVAGFALLEAETLADALDLASRTPCAVAYGVVEVWPLHTDP